jgi:hypothetical protein
MGVITAAESYRHLLSRESREKLDFILGPDHQVSLAYRGCMICKEIADSGIWQEVSTLHESHEKKR